MPGLLSVAALLFVAGEFDVNAVVVTETRVGEAPLVAGDRPKAGVVGILTPGVELQLRRPNTEVRLEYGPRIFWRQPNGSPRLSPLLLHAANLSAKGRWAPTVTWTGFASASAGEADYTTLGQVLAPSGGTAMPPGPAGPPGGTAAVPAQAALPSVAELVSVSGGAGSEIDVSRNWRLGTKAEVGYRGPTASAWARWPSIPPPPPPPPVGSPGSLPRQTSVLAEPSSTVRITRLDELVLTTPLSQRWYEDGTDIFTLTPQLAWQTRLSPTGGLRLAGGAAYARFHGSSSLGSGSVTRPVGSADVSGILARQRGITMQGQAELAVDYFVDPVLGALGSRASTSARLVLLFETDWSAGIEGAFSSNLRRQPLMNGTQLSDETVASASLPVRYRASENLMVEFGGRWSDRAPLLWAEGPHFHQRQLWAYCVLTWTTRNTPKAMR